MQIDVILDARAGPEKITKLGLLAEQQGIRAVWTSSLIDARDPYVNFSELARSSSSIQMGPIAVNPFDTHPGRIATSLLSLNEVAQGRASIVIGGGGEALQALGIEPKRRVRAVAECIEIIKSASPDELLNYTGEIFQISGYRPGWVTAKPPLVYAGANMNLMLKMAGRVADGMMMSDMPPRLAHEALEKALDSRHAAGRATQGFKVNNFLAWHLYEDEDKARKEARQWLALRGLFRRWVMTTFLSDTDYDIIEAHQAEFYRATAERTHVIEGVPDRILDSLVDHLTLAGHVNTIDAKIAHLQEFKEAGLTEVALRLYDEPAASIRLIGECVVPALQ